MSRIILPAVVGTLSLITIPYTYAADAMTVANAAAGVCDKTLSSASLVQQSIDRAKSTMSLNAIITLDEQGALKAARQIDNAADADRCKPLAGVPVVVKDNIHVANLPSTAGTPALKDFVPGADAPVVAKLREAGAIVLAKTNMHELAFGISGHNPAFHSGAEVGVRNAYNANFVAGGSSSGTGAAIGARVVMAGLGTDTGGSVRIPCAFNGCASLRPTVGRYDNQAIAPISQTRDTAGPMALSVADVELLDRVISGSAASTPAQLSGVRIGLVKELLANSDKDTLGVFESAIDQLTSAGVEIVELNAPELLTLNAAVGFPVALYEAYDDMQSYLLKYDTGVTIEQLAANIVSPDVKGTYEGLVLPRKLPTPDNTLIDAQPVYESAIAEGLPALQAFYSNLFADNNVEAIVFPTVPVVAMSAGPGSSG
ncbi:MAG: amidase family protein, partial [Pseudomonadota bacterium]